MRQEPNMRQEIVRELEMEIEDALAHIFANLKELPVVPTQHTLHLMAKAAVTVYETAVENSHS